ncbi:MAG: hypothetical protein JWN36_2219 [Microbacteriaceae bacterium]|nr:hypothetical protein [Microbacteriaceae bacterium]
MWLYNAPVWLTLPLFVIAYVGVSLGLLLLVRPWVRRVAVDREEWDRVLGYSMTTYGLFYGILLALVAVAVYQNYVSVHDVVLNEASALGSLYRISSTFPQPLAGHLQSELHSYAQHVISVDWPLQRQDVIPAEGTMQVTRFQQALYSYNPVSRGDQAQYSQALLSFDTFVEARRQRLNETTLAIPGLLWVLIWVGAAVNAFMIALIKVKRVRVHLMMAGLIAVYVGLLIYVTAAMDHPYSGPISIGPDDFRSLIDQLMSG